MQPEASACKQINLFFFFVSTHIAIFKGADCNAAAIMKPVTFQSIVTSSPYAIGARVDDNWSKPSNSVTAGISMAEQKLWP